jgi:hypothetical protein
MKSISEVHEFLTDTIEEDIEYKNSTIYESSDWRKFGALSVSQPVQRKLTAGECVFDLDGVTTMHKIMIPNYLKEIGMKFIAWESGPTGMHIHWWSDIVGKKAKKTLTKHMSAKIEEMFGVKNDMGPMGHEVIRAEYSIHPTKGYQKKLLMVNLSPLFFLNDINPSLRQKVFDSSSTEGSMVGKVAERRDGSMPTCIKYILSHQFADGRERLLFSIVSWYKASGKSEQDTFVLCREWCSRQDYRVNTRMIWAKIKSSSGQVGCMWRHDILEELGVDMEECKWEK